MLASGWVEYTKRKVVCQEKSTIRYGRILLICSGAKKARRQEALTGEVETIAGRAFAPTLNCGYLAPALCPN